jgi:hypothetical protein
MEYGGVRVEMRDSPEGRSGQVEEPKARKQLPSIKEWRELYDATLEFKRLECWNWMWDSDVFGVQNPESGEVGYCCVMGGAGVHFALAVYLGTEGLQTYRKIQRNGFSLPPFDALILQRCLMASFEDRKCLAEQDFQVVKALGIKFRGRKSWTMFRSYVPGYFPWYLNRKEARFLTVALRQAVDVALRFKDDPEMLNSPLKNQCLVRVPKKDGNGVVWVDEWVEPAPFEKKEIDTLLVEEGRLNGIIDRNLPRRGTWEMDFFYFPRTVWEKGEKPYYPCAILIVDHILGICLGFSLSEPVNIVPEFQEAFLKAVEHIEVMPEEVLVKRSESLKRLTTIASKLRIKVRKVKGLPALEKAQESFLGFLEDKRFL